MKVTVRTILLIVLLVMFSGCGVDVLSRLEIDSESETVKLVLNLEIDESNYSYIKGGQSAFKSSLEKNFWNGAVIAEDEDGYKITTSFDTLDEYNTFMNKRINQDAIVKESGAKLEGNQVIGYEKIYIYDDLGKYYNYELDQVYKDLDFIGGNFSLNDLVSTNKLELTLDGDKLESNVDGYFEVENLYNVFLKSGEALINYTTRFDEESEEVIINEKSFEISAELEIEGSVEAVKDLYIEYGFDVEVLDNTLYLVGEYNNIKPGIIGEEVLSIKCSVEDKNIFSYTYKCNSQENNSLTLQGEELVVNFTLNESDDIGESIKVYSENGISKLPPLYITGIIFIIIVYVVTLLVLKLRRTDVVEGKYTEKDDFIDDVDLVVGGKVFKINRYVNARLIILFILLATPILTIDAGISNSLGYFINQWSFANILKLVILLT